MSFIKGEDRNQLVCLPQCIEDYIAEDNPVRVIDAFVDGLNIKELGFQRDKPSYTGRPAYDPRDLLKLYLYGYMNRIRSSRRLEMEAHRNLEVMWLINRLMPDFKTIADFRRNNTAALKEVFKEFVLICKEWNLFGRDLVSVDGSKFKACNGKKWNFTIDKLDKKLKGLEQRIDEYILALNEEDKNEVPEEEKVNTMKERLEELKKRQAAYESYKQKIKEQGTTQISLTDPDSRSMVNNQKIEVCYNVQTTVEEKNKLILDYETMNQVKDLGMLSVMGKRAKALLGVESLEILADKGYYVASDIKECIDHQITPYISRPINPNECEEKPLKTEDFVYDREKDCYVCPSGAVLAYRSTFKKRGNNYRRYNNYEACNECSTRSQCTTAKRNGRDVDRFEHQNLLEQIEAQTLANLDKYKKRQCLSEHPFGTIKRSMETYYLLTKGMESVSAEMGLVFCAYNLKRVTNILGVKELVKRLRERARLLFKFLWQKRLRSVAIA